MKEVPHRPAQTERGFNGVRRLSDSQIIPLHISIALCQARKVGRSYRKRGMSNKQSNKTRHHSSTSTEQLER